ncbi:MAG: hypothetical protein HOA58_10325 [Rhodospirillaceae bacterium]|nr:hypothetical protein [Rhodospirillaceae bacterium]
MTKSPHQDVARQLAELDHNPAKPLILCDADEVLLAFMAAFERFLHGQGLYYAWRSYALDGNVLERGSGIALAMPEGRRLIEGFYAGHADTLAPVAGASQALKRLAERADIVILTNLWQEHRAARQHQLASYGLDYPVISNDGSKGPPVAWFAARGEAPLYFIDDSPRHHTSVAEDAARAVRIHFIAERRLAGLLGPAEDSHYRVDTWPSARVVIERDLTAKGY